MYIRINLSKYMLESQVQLVSLFWRFDKSKSKSTQKLQIVLLIFLFYLCHQTFLFHPLLIQILQPFHVYHTKWHDTYIIWRRSNSCTILCICLANWSIWSSIIIWQAYVLCWNVIYSHFVSEALLKMIVQNKDE